jgi:hypothetical protein
VRVKLTSLELLTVSDLILVQFLLLFLGGLERLDLAT